MGRHSSLFGFCFAGYRCPIPKREGVKHPAAAHLCTPVPAWCYLIGHRIEKYHRTFRQDLSFSVGSQKGC